MNDRHRLETALAPLVAAGLVARAGTSANLTRSDPGRVIQVGVPALDLSLPCGGLACDGLHEFTGDAFDPAPLAFATFVAARAARDQDGPIVWIRLLQDAGRRGLPYPFGVAELGLDPDRLLLVETPRAIDALWAAEETLRARCAAVLLLDGVTPDLTAERRLLLAAANGPTTPLVCYPRRDAKAGSSAATTRWHLVSQPAAADAAGLDAPRWLATLERCRGTRGGDRWLLEWRAEQASLRVIDTMRIAEPLPEAASLPNDPDHRTRARTG